jgi:hypothetical protein
MADAPTPLSWFDPSVKTFMSLSLSLISCSASSLVLAMSILVLFRHVGGLVMVVIVSMSLRHIFAESKMS